MPDVSLHGRVAPKSKSINVEANLLAERLDNQRRIRTFVQQRVAALAGVILFGAFAIPPAHRLYSQTEAHYQIAFSKEQVVSKALDAIKQKQADAKPAHQDEQAAEQIHLLAHEVVGQTTLFLNQVNPDLFLTNLSVEVSNKSIKFTAQVEAQDYEAAKGFMTDLGSTNRSDPNAETTLLQMNSDTSIAAWQNGVAFSLEHKATVGP